MSRILVVTDEQWVRNDVHSALSLPDVELVDHTDPATAAGTAIDAAADAIVVDMQVTNMGGMAVTRDVRDVEPSVGAVPVILLLDRSADTFIARRAGAQAWVTKPFSADELRSAVTVALGGEAKP